MEVGADFKEKCPVAAQHLFSAMEEVLTGAGYHENMPGLVSGSTRSTSGNFCITRQHVDKTFRIVWYHHESGKIQTKDIRGKGKYEYHHAKIMGDLNLW